MTTPTLERPAAVAEPPPDRLLTRAQVAQLLNVSERTVDRLATAGRLTRVKVGGSDRMVRYREAQVRGLVDQAQG